GCDSGRVLHFDNPRPGWRRTNNRARSRPGRAAVTGDNMTTRQYKLGPKALAFLNDRSSTVIGLVGPYGSGKSTLIPLRIQTDAAQTTPDSDGARRYRVLIL